MFSRLNLLLCASVFMFLAACGGSRGGAKTSYDDDEGGGSASAPVRVDELKEAHKDAVSLTEENHKLAKEAFDLKNKLGLPTDED